MPPSLSLQLYDRERERERERERGGGGDSTSLRNCFFQDVALETVPVTALSGSSEDDRRALGSFFFFFFRPAPQVRQPEVSRRGGDIPVCVSLIII